jgi:hypothetical protein
MENYLFFREGTRGIYLFLEEKAMPGPLGDCSVTAIRMMRFAFAQRIIMFQ